MEEILLSIENHLKNLRELVDSCKKIVDSTDKDKTIKTKDKKD